MKILVSQPEPSNLTPYKALTDKFGAELCFRPFFLTEPLSSKEFRAQRINLAEYTAVVFSSRLAIDAYFQMCKEMRFKVPETMKYFCTTEIIAMYLQKHIVYRKRKIFFGDGTPASLVAQIGPKHKGENFLITTSGKGSGDAIARLFEESGLKYCAGRFVKPVPQDLHDVDLHAFDLVVLYNPNDLESLRENFPDFSQGDIKFVAYGKSIAAALEDAGFAVAVKGPTPEAPSAAKAIELYLSKKA
ncbi:MAG: uroporphyrinogen-III synthase [Bacteroidales bacterium]|nr:uroporphyrinogen-III synthase [Bacteroidales bacterium]